ncbi:MAG TPA: hypothetical protein VK190_02400 [Pseudoneobacillus sp.]|jgi:rubrerythrin|nr:hypothetical protein [Pseudoneobacillus sp.]
MDIIKLKEKYERELKHLQESIPIYESSSNNELRIASRTLKIEAEAVNIIVEALSKQIPMQAFYEYDNEFICPACGHEDDGYEVTTIKVCPECGQKLKWS